MPVERILEAMKAMEESTILLPHYGAQLCELVQVLLTSAKANEDREMIETLIATAVVRRSVVVRLIELLVARKHRGYAHVNLADVRTRARQLPEHGIPDGLLPLQARKQPLRERELFRRTQTRSTQRRTFLSLFQPQVCSRMWMA
jgi:hypothetical protein